MRRHGAIAASWIHQFPVGETAKSEGKIDAIAVMEKVHPARAVIAREHGQVRGAVCN
jgi:hypothetical protein